MHRRNMLFRIDPLRPALRRLVTAGLPGSTKINLDLLARSRDWMDGYVHLTAEVACPIL